MCRNDPHHTTPPSRNIRVALRWTDGTNWANAPTGDSGDDDDTDATRAMIEEHIEELRRRHTNYAARRNRLARTNAEVRRLRDTVRHAEREVQKHQRSLVTTLVEVERRLVRDPTVVTARQRHQNARRTLRRAQTRYCAVTEAFLGPSPPTHSSTLGDVLEVMRLE